ncbi:hypothetical protein KIL84_022858 [Mauremys mutica]|uniref:Uncharacterized protein n=1 Tax=Mauremys mutica TaxID=74926 RepID=A0A9D4APC0_9SAUR|nr:hypothetical protein KIL84_022858 [Mauremys mutica]
MEFQIDGWCDPRETKTLQSCVLGNILRDQPWHGPDEAYYSYASVDCLAQHIMQLLQQTQKRGANGGQWGSSNGLELLRRWNRLRINPPSARAKRGQHKQPICYPPR